MRPSMHIAGIDLIRFIAASMVMVYHYAYWVWAFPSGMSARAAHGLVDLRNWQWFAQYGWVGVQAFFVVSGFVIAFSSASASPSTFLVSRIVRLGPAAWIVGTLTLTVALFALPAESSHLFKWWVRSMLFVPFGPWIDSVYWTLGVELAFYSVVFALLCTKGFKSLVPLMQLVGIGSTTYWITWWVLKDSYTALSASQQWRSLELLLVHHGVFFAAGVEMYRAMSVSWKWTRLPYHFVLLAGCLVQIAAESRLKTIKTGLPQEAIYAQMPWLILMAAMILMIAGKWTIGAKTPNLSRTLGLMTYPLYLFHNVAGATIMGVSIANGASQEVAFAIAVLCSLALAWAVAALLEPPLQRFTRQKMLALFRTRRKDA